MEEKVSMNISARHVHLTKEAHAKLFDHDLTVRNPLNQVGQFAANETVTVKTDKGVFENVRIIGPLRSYNQVELSMTDARKLGIKPPVRKSGNLNGAEMVTIATEKGEISNEIKYADFASYIDCIFTNSNVVWGAGLGSEFYSAGRGFLVSSTEQTYMDIFRIYGLPLGIILIVAVYYPALYFFSSRFSRCLQYKRFILAYVLYMILAGTNPLLISSTGMLVWAIGLTFVYKIKTNQLDICNNSIL